LPGTKNRDAEFGEKRKSGKGGGKINTQPTANSRKTRTRNGTEKRPEGTKRVKGIFLVIGAREASKMCKRHEGGRETECTYFGGEG